MVSLFLYLNMKKNTSIFSAFLKALDVPHTSHFSDENFRKMTFQSLFGFSHLLKDYNIPNDAWKLDDKSEFEKIDTPFLAQSNNGIFVIVNSVDKENDAVSYSCHEYEKTIPFSNFISQMNGIVLTAYPDKSSTEPDYKSHLVSTIVDKISKYALIVILVGIVTYFFVTRHLFANVSTIFIFLLDSIGLWLSYMLLQKSLGIHTSTSDKVCGVLERGGCDIITTSKASKLFGVFSWSEVGFGYFSVSLITLLIFPHLWQSLAICNLLCLPYTVWSITYQKFIAHHWCTLCVGVQSILWLLFLCYLGGGLLKDIFPLKFDLFILVGVYIVAVLSLNRLIKVINLLIKK